MKTRLRNLLALSIGVLILAYVIWNLGPEKIGESLTKTRIELFLLAGVFYLINEFFASLALWIPIRGSMRDMMMTHMRGMLYSHATPGRVGYYYTAFSITKRTEKTTSANVGFVTVIQGINFLIKIILCIIAVIYFFGLQAHFMIISLLPVSIVAMIILILYTNILNKIVGKLPLIGRFLNNIERMQKASRELETKKLVQMITVSLISWIFMSAQWYYIAHSIGAEIDFIIALLLQPLLTTVMFIPVSPAGLGLTEAGGAVLFNLMGLSEAAGVTFILLVRFNSIIIDSLGFIDKIYKT